MAAQVHGCRAQIHRVVTTHSLRTHHSALPLRQYACDRPDLESLYKKYGGKEGERRTSFRGADRLKLIYGILVARRTHMGCNLDIPRLVKSKCLLGFFPLHDKVELRALQAK